MADLGAIGRTDVDDGLAQPEKRYHVPLYAPAGRQPGSTVPLPMRTDGALGGIVTENGDPLPHARVFVLWRANSALIAATRTDANGAWQVEGLDPTRSDEYSVLFLDNEGGVVYNDAVYAVLTAY